MYSKLARRVFYLVVVVVGNVSLLIGAIYGLQTAVSAQAPIRYVATTGSDSNNDCTDSASPCATVQHAVDTAVSGDEIRVAAGEYTDIHTRGTTTQTVALNKTVTLLGGFTTNNWETADPANNPTILNAHHQGRVISITGSISPTISGFHITGGNAANQGNRGGGICAETAQVTLTHNQIYDNWGYFREFGKVGGRGTGGGIYLENSPNAVLDGNHVHMNYATFGGGVWLADSPNALITHMIIEGNQGSHLGGGIKHYGGLLLRRSHDAIISRNIVRGNHADNHCGGICIQESRNVTISHNDIISNHAGSPGFIGGVGGLAIADVSLNTLVVGNIISDNHGVSHIGAVDVWRSEATFINNAIINNYISEGGAVSGIRVGRSTTSWLHNTIANNWGGDGNGVYVLSDVASPPSTAVFTNTIIANHAIGISVTTASTVTVDGILWHDNATNVGGAGDVTVSNEHEGDPAFAEDGYHLTAVSPAVDKCTNSPITTDIDNNLRPIGLGCDLGADELGIIINLPIIRRE